MANLITHSLSYAKEGAVEPFLKPMFVDNDIRQAITILQDVKTSIKLDYVSTLKKITKAYAKGSSFAASTGVTITQRTLTVGGVKAEVHQDGRVFLNWVKQEALRKGVDIHKIDGTMFESLIMSVWTAALSRDLNSQIFFNDPTKETITNGAPTGTLDANYAISDYKGFWTLFLDDVRSGDFPSGQVLDLNTSTYQTTVAVKGKKTLTLSGTSGTANVTINGRTFLATFSSSLTQTATNFVNDHAASIAAFFGNAVVTSSGADIIVEAGIPGMNVTTSIANVSGNLNGSVANTTAYVQNTTLKADAAKTAFKNAYAILPNVARGMKADLRIVCTQTVYDNYMESLETATGIPQAYIMMIDGVERLTFRGIPLVPRAQWDENIDEDFNSVRPHRFMITTLDNLVFGTDGTGDTAMFETWYNTDEQENRMRCEYLGGTQYRHPDFTVLAY